MIMSEVYHDHELDALPQAQGFYRPSMGKVLIHTEKRGPAFDAANATARLMKAISRGVFLDVMPAWTDLIAALGVQPSPLSSRPVYWSDMVDALYDALLGSAGGDFVLLWAKADEAVRGYALVAALAWDKDAKSTQGDDHWDDVDMDRLNEIVATYAVAAKLRAFARGCADDL